MSAILQTDSWVETEGGCSGPKSVRNQPSRETSGVILTEQLSDKYANEFDLPFRNLSRYIKEINGSWDRLTPEQKDLIRQQMADMKSNVTKETFENAFNGLSSSIDYIKENPKQRVPEILDTMWSPNQEQKILLGSSIDDIKFYFDKWVSDKSYKMYCNWKNGLITFFTILLFVLFGALIGYSMK